MRALKILSFSVLVLAGVSCDKATPIAPADTVITLAANPGEIAIDGKSEITVTARRENGSPVNTGTQVRLSTTLGALDEDLLETDIDGFARTTLRSDGRIGQADLVARSGAASSDTVMVQIGRLAGSVSLQASPSSVTESGGVITLLALVRDGQGQPLPNVPVNFASDIGILDSQGQFGSTDSSGQASDVLTVTETDIEALAGDQFAVTFEASGSGGGVSSDSVNVSILRKPVASFTRTVTQFTVVFSDTSENEPTSWRWTFGDGSTPVNQRSPSHVYSTAGTFVVTLTVTNSAGSDSISQAVTVPNV